MEYHINVTITDPLHQVSYSYHDPRRCPSRRICHLHITRQANTILHAKNKDKGKTNKTSEIQIQTSPYQ
jgi:hypothetical protein